jgi:outer membrane protein assembly factor BamB
MCYQRAGILPDAIKTLKKVLVLAPGHSEAQARLQQLHNECQQNPWVECEAYRNQNEHCILVRTQNDDEGTKKKFDVGIVQKQRKEEEQSALLGELNPRAMAIQRDVDENYWAQMRRPEQVERIAAQVADTILVLFDECGVPPGEPIDDELDDKLVGEYFEQLDDPIRQLINYERFHALVLDVHSQLSDYEESEHKAKVLGGEVGVFRRKRATKALSIVTSALFNPQRYTRSDVLRPARAADSMTYAGRGVNPAHTNVYPAPAAKNGTLQWKFPIGDTYSPCISDGIIYVGTTDGFDTQATQPKGFLYALSTEKSRQERVIWRYQAGDEIKSTPCVVDGIVYFGSRDYTFYAIDAKDGTLIWRFETEDRIHSSPTVFDGVVYFGSWDYVIYALDATNGQEIWRYRTEARVNSSPSVHNGIVYIGTMNGSRRKPAFYALSAKNGSLVFKLDTGKSFQDACVYDDKCFVSDHDTVYALEPKTGAILWQRQLKPFLRNCAATEEALYVTSSQGTSVEGIVYALDAKNGSTLWTYQTDDRIVSTPCLCEDILYVTAQDSFLYVFSAKDGEIKWKYQTGKFINLDPCVHQGVVYVISEDGYLYAIG